MKQKTLLKRMAKLSLIAGLLTGASFIAGAAAQRSCLPRFCTAPSDVPLDPVIETNHARIETLTIALPFTHEYGALEVLDSSYIAAAGDGALFHITSDLVATRVPFSIPIDDSEFYRDNGREGIQANSFSVKDILVRRRTNASVEILATYHVWFAERKCYTLRMSSATADAELTTLTRDWQTVYDAEPCAPIKDSGIRFAGTGAGGRMARVSDSEVLLTIGDHEYDGSKGTPAQDMSSSFGKTILVNTLTGEGTTYSAGHRNPQGLVRTRDGRIWATEHGPKGGDELNLLHPGGNYGWPHATYGAQYQEYAWPLAPTADQHATFVRPVYSWVPSVGISQLIQIDGRKFTSWAGDLLVSSLRGSTLFRIRVDGERVAFAEPIKVNARIRDLVEHPAGDIALLSSDRLIVLRPAPATVAATVSTTRPSRLIAFLDTTRMLVMNLAGKRTL